MSSRNRSRLASRSCAGVFHMEGGGRYGDCITWPKEARRALEASDRLAALASFEDSETEALLENARRSAHELKKSIGAACSGKIDRDLPLTPAVVECAEARNRIGASVSKLVYAVETLAAVTEERTGMRLPSPHESCVQR